MSHPPHDAPMETGAGSPPAPILSLRAISKRFGEVVANEAIDLDLYAGEIHGLLGENGAGKSTLMNIVFGSLHPDGGEIELDGERMEAITTRHAIELGVSMVHQHFMLIPTLTVVENVRLVVRAMPGGKKLGAAGVAERIRSVGGAHGIELDPEALVDELSVGEKLRLEILKALVQGELRGGMRVFILDEPTALLTRQEIVQLFSTLRSLARAGTAVVIITHKLDEVGETCDRVTVLRDGTVVESRPVAGTTSAQLGRMMIGRELPERRHERSVGSGTAVLEVEGLGVDGEGGQDLLAEITLSVRAGEIVGLAGVAGSGQELLAECVTGLRAPDRGAIKLAGRDIAGDGRRRLIERDIAHVPEDRRHNALVTSATIEHNALLGIHRWSKFQSRGWQRRAAIDEFANEVKREYEVRAPGVRTPMEQLSGGNQQRVVVGRELYKEPTLIVASGPTRGLDIAGCEYIQDRLVEQRARGAAILLLSLDLDELLTLSDRLLVLQGGRLQGELDHDDFDLERIGLMMGGESQPGADSPAAEGQATS